LEGGDLILRAVFETCRAAITGGNAAYTRKQFLLKMLRCEIDLAWGRGQ
jgi:hypothetical protein